VVACDALRGRRARGRLEGGVGPRAPHASGAVSGIRLVVRFAHASTLLKRFSRRSARRWSHCWRRGERVRAASALEKTTATRTYPVRVSTPRHGEFPLYDSVHRDIVRLAALSVGPGARRGGSV